MGLGRDCNTYKTRRDHEELQVFLEREEQLENQYSQINTRTPYN